LGAATIGAGPLALYSFYDEVVDKPVIKVTGPVVYEKSLVRGYMDGQTHTNHYDTDAPVLLNEPIEAVYPVIHANIPVTNAGIKTAESCTTRILTSVTDPYFGRWSDEANEQSAEIHPGTSRTLTILRFCPTNVEFGQFNQDDHQYLVTRVFDVLEPGYTGDGIEINDISYNVQIPVHQNKEKRKLGDEAGAFFGRQIPTQESYEIDIEFGASDCGRTVKGVGAVNLERGVNEGEWETSFQMYDCYEELVEYLYQHGW